MRAFLDELDGRLAELSVTPPPRTPSPHTRRRLAAACGVATAGGLAAFGLTAGSPPKLPVLGAPVADARALAGKPGVPPAAQFELAASRVFPTPDGPGHVITSRDGQRLCVVLPDRHAPDTYGSGCASAARIDARGLAGEMVAAGHRRRPGRSLVAFVLPAGAGPAVELRGPDGTPLPVSVHDGVAVATLKTEACLRFDVNGAPREHLFEAPFVDRSVAFSSPPRTAEP